MKQFSFIWYIFILLLQYTNFAYTAYLRLYCRTIDNYTSIELDSPLPLLGNKCFNQRRKTVIYAFGYTSSPDAYNTKIIIQSYLTLKKYNVFVLDWEKEAEGTPTIVLDVVVYPASAVPNAKKVGEICGRSLNKMSDCTLNLNTTHLIGHSLGAHLLGYCGQELQKFNKNVSRITGLDPAGPMFDGPVSLDGLDASRAEFVDAWHTNPGFLGSNERIGQVDVWFNCNQKYQPHCINEPLLEKDSCSHGAVCRYYSQAILNSTAFPAEYSESCKQSQSLNVTTRPNNVIYLGETTNRGARGNYYLNTSAQSPYYAKGVDLSQST